MGFYVWYYPKLSLWNLILLLRRTSDAPQTHPRRTSDAVQTHLRRTCVGAPAHLRRSAPEIENSWVNLAFHVHCLCGLYLRRIGYKWNITILHGPSDPYPLRNSCFKISQTHLGRTSVAPPTHLQRTSDAPPTHCVGRKKLIWGGGVSGALHGRDV